MKVFFGDKERNHQFKCKKDNLLLVNEKKAKPPQ